MQKTGDHASLPAITKVSAFVGEGVSENKLKLELRRVSRKYYEFFALDELQKN